MKALFILAAPKCSVKVLLKSATVVSKTFFHQLENYNDQLQFIVAIIFNFFDNFQQSVSHKGYS